VPLGGFRILSLDQVARPLLILTAYPTGGLEPRGSPSPAPRIGPQRSANSPRIRFLPPPRPSLARFRKNAPVAVYMALDDSTETGCGIDQQAGLPFAY
jgi:hypothetical protein